MNKGERFGWVDLSELEALRKAVKSAPSAEKLEELRRRPSSEEFDGFMRNEHGRGFREGVRVEVAKLEALRLEAHAAGFSEGAASVDCSALQAESDGYFKRCAALTCERDSWRERCAALELEVSLERDRLEGERGAVASLQSAVCEAEARCTRAFERGKAEGERVNLAALAEHWRKRAYEEFSPLTERCERAEAEANRLREALDCCEAERVMFRDLGVNQAGVMVTLDADNEAFRGMIREAERETHAAKVECARLREVAESAEATARIIRDTMDREAADAALAYDEVKFLREVRASQNGMISKLESERADAETYGNRCFDEGFTTGRKLGSREASHDTAQYLRSLAAVHLKAGDRVSVNGLLYIADECVVACETMRKGRSGE